MIGYNKLIRDKIPEIIKKSGKKCIDEVMDTDTYLRYLDIKLKEELSEYQADKLLEEPAAYWRSYTQTTHRLFRLL